MWDRYTAASRHLFRGAPALDELVQECARISIPTLIMERTPSAHDPLIGFSVARPSCR
jgi:hypothetical protein